MVLVLCENIISIPAGSANLACRAVCLSFDDGKFRCPGCGGLDVRHSLKRGLVDALMEMFSRVPFRCRGCARRFYSMEPYEETEEDAVETEHQQAG